MSIERDDNEDDFEPARFHGEVRRLDLDRDKRARIHKRKKERNRRLPSPLSELSSGFVVELVRVGALNGESDAIADRWYNSKFYLPPRPSNLF